MTAEVHDLSGRRVKPAAGPAPMPMSIECEQAILGSLMLDRGLVGPICTEVSAEDFSEEIHQRIFQVAVDLIGSGQPATPGSINPFLGEYDLGQGVTVGAYLANLCAQAMPGSMAPGYGRIVRNFASRRRLVQTASSLDERARLADVRDDPATIAAEYILELQAIASASGADTTRHISEYADNLVEIADGVRSGEIQHETVTTGYRDLDLATNGYEPGTMWVTAGRPGMGKTILVNSSAVRTARTGVGVLEFPLEIGPDQMVARHLADIAYRSGSPIAFRDIGRRARDLSESDMLAVRNAQQRLRSMPIEIDRRSTITVAQIGAKVAQTKRSMAAQGTRLGVVFIDHLDFIRASDRYSGNRTQEIGEICIGLKDIARSNDVCVNLLCQLSREVEKRQSKDRRPGLSDLRNCLAGDAKVLNADTGLLVTMQDIAKGNLRFNVFGIDANLKLIKRPIVDAWSVGEKQLYTITTRTGRKLSCTKGHRLMSDDGWKCLEDISVGSVIAVPRVIPEHTWPARTVSEGHALLLGLLLGDGYLSGTAMLCIAPEEDPQPYIELGAAEFGVAPVVKEISRSKAKLIIYTTGRLCGAKKNPMTRWLRDIGCWGIRGPKKHIPARIFAENNAVLAACLRGLFHADGSYISSKKNSGTVRFVSISEQLAKDVHRGLMRFGIVSTIQPARHGDSGYGSQTKTIWYVAIYGSDQIALFAHNVGFLHAKHERMLKAINKVTKKLNGDLDRIPLHVNDRVAELKKRAGLSHAKLGWRDQGKRMSRATAGALALVLNDEVLLNLSQSDILWEQVASIESSLKAEAFDLTVGDVHNFVVDGFITHNSGDLEQVADVAMFLYREEYYLLRSPEYLAGDQAAAEAAIEARGKLEAILGKVRAGPTPTAHLFCNPASSSISAMERQR